MHRFVILLALVTTTPTPPGSFTTAKNKAMEVTKDHPVTLYCQCTFDMDSNILRVPECDYQPRDIFTASGNINERADRMEWDHVVPASRLGAGRQCWEHREQFDECRTSTGGLISSRSCCRKVDPTFRNMENDLHNLWPAVGEINGDRSDKEFGGVAGEERHYGICDFEVSRSFAEPRHGAWGEIARAYLYMAKTWGLTLLEEEQVQYRSWNEADPPSIWELERDKRIAVIQGNHNTFVTEHSHVHEGKPCTPREECCRVCSTSQACGNGCISADNNCSKEPGCSCNKGDLCPN